MINQFGPESRGGHLGVASFLAKLWFARETLTNLWGLMAAWRGDKEKIVPKQKHSSTRQGLSTPRGEERGRG